MKKKVSIILIAVLLLTLLLGATEAAQGSVSNLLEPIFGGARTDIVDSIGRPLDASASAGGYTITAEAVIGDRYHLSVVYTLTRDDGGPIPDSIDFDRWDQASQFGSGSMWREYGNRDGLPANQVRLVESAESGELPILFFNRHAHVVFSGLRETRYNEKTEEDENVATLAEGPWVLDFAICYGDATVNVPVHDLKVTAEDGREFTVKRIQLSPFSAHISTVAQSPYDGYETLAAWEEAGRPHSEWEYARDFTVALRMKDGAPAPEISMGSSESATFGKPTLKAAYNASFDVPVLPEEIEALVLCGTEIPLG